MNDIKKAIEEAIEEVINCMHDTRERELAISSLEKQIPKKPIIVTRKGQELEQGCGADTNCPNCNHTIFSGFYYTPWNTAQTRHKHCITCGQAIEWDYREK